MDTENADLTDQERSIANDLFAEVFPELVRKTDMNCLEEAATCCVAALKAALIALRKESGSTP